jgi:hypothetical protein
LWPRHLRLRTRGPIARAAPSTPPCAALPLRPSLTRFTDIARVYHRRVRSSPLAPSAKPICASAFSRDEPLVYHSTTFHCDPYHVHLMVTRRLTSILRPVDWLVLMDDATPSPSPIPSICVALADPHWHRAMEEYMTDPAGQPHLRLGVVSPWPQRGHQQVDFLPQAHVRRLSGSVQGPLGPSRLHSTP